ncbi:hypothetical protein GCM10027341_02470 [Spirosoma knui]
MLVAEGYYEYGKLYAAASDYISAHRWFLKSLRIVEPRGDSYELARLHVRLADLAILQSQYPETVQHAYEALAVAKRSQSKRAMIRACALLARVHEINWTDRSPPSLRWPKANSDSALYYFRKVEALAYQLGDPMEVAHVKESIGGQLIGRNNSQAITYLTDALAIATRQNSADKLHMTLSVASAYLHFGQPKRAWTYIQRARRMGQVEYPDVYYWQFAVESSLVEFYRQTGDWKQVAIHAERIHQWEKRDLLADREGAISRLHLDYQTQKKDLLLKAQQKQVQLQAENLQAHQQMTLTALALLVLATVASVVFYVLYRKNRRISVLNAQLVNEQNHRVKNNLQVVSSLLSLQANRLTDVGAKEAIEKSRLRVESMVILHRRLYEGDKLAYVNLHDFIDEIVETVLQTYGYESIQPTLELESIYLSADDAVAVGLLVNELTTNACKHAFPGQSSPSYRLVCRRNKQQVNLTVADNGPDFVSDVALAAKTSFGMRLIQTLSNQLRGAYQFSYQNGTVFTLTFSRDEP